MANEWTSAGLDLHVDTSGSGQRASLENGLRTAIQERRLAAGTLLPSTRALAGDLGVSRGTVVAAYDQLIAEGYLLARPGAGTVVSDLGPPSAPVAERRRPSTFRLDLRPGTPDVTSFPMSAWLRATRQALTAAPASVFGYGDVRGRYEARVALADYLGRTRGVQARPERVVVTAGVTQGLFLLGTALAESGSDVVAAEDPGFSIHRPVIRQAGQRIVPLPVDELGARTDLLADTGAGAVLLTPAHQYPTGVTLQPSRRRDATTWARAADGVVIEDDYDGEFRYDRQPIGALQGTAPEQVVYLGTASKTLAPGLRLGWMVLPERLVDPLRDVKLRIDLIAPTVTQLTLAEMISSHAYDRHIRTVRLRYRRRRDLLVEALGQIGPDLVAGIPAGLQAAVRLPANGPSEDEVIAAAAAEGLALEGMARHWQDDDPHPPALLVGFCRPSERAYPGAVALLVRVLRRML